MPEALTTSDLYEGIGQFIEKIEPEFLQINEGNPNKLNFIKECEFARQHLMKNSYLLGVARENPDSLKSAILNIAAVGISLNPISQHAFLVPRELKIGDKKMKCICLDISYRGLSKLATDTGAVTYIKAEIKRKNDTFHYYGFHVEPEFRCDPFASPKERGEIEGAYALARLPDGSTLCETMTIKEIYDIRDSSEAYKSAKKKGGWYEKQTPWVAYEGEMIKKTLIKRLAKTLPQSEEKMRSLHKAIAVLNEHEGIEYMNKEDDPVHYTGEQAEYYKKYIDSEDWVNLLTLIFTMPLEAQEQLYKLNRGNIPHGQRTRARKQFENNLNDARSTLETLIGEIPDMINNAEDLSLIEKMEGFSEITINHICKELNNESFEIMIRKLITE